MTWHTWLLFISSTFFISATPGSNMLLAFQFGVNYGFKKTLYTLAGLTTGLFVLLTISLTFIGWLSQSSPTIFEFMKIAAAIYLGYLGYQIWCNASASMTSKQIDIMPTPSQLFRTGVAVSLSNPKAILFFAALFPKFLNPKSPLLPQYIILALSFFAIETIWQLIYTSSGQALSTWLNQGKRLMWLNRLCAIIFALLAIGLLWDTIHAA